MYKIFPSSSGLHVPVPSPALTVKTIPTPSKSGTSASFHLPDNQKRWLVVGICLHKILLPNLRNFIKPEIQKHYTNLKTSHKIHTQVFPTQLQKDGTFALNYESIHNNEQRHKKKVKKYDYTVKSDVDLAKLYLKPFMAKFSAFDDTCDLSAVLGILSCASVFSLVVQNLAKDVRQEVRNEWGHCNFDNWTEIRFAKSFQLMESLLKALHLTPNEEKRLTSDLQDWETKGMQLCLGHIVDSSLVKLIEHEVSQLSTQVESLEEKQQDEYKQVHKELISVKDSIDDFQGRIVKEISSLETSHKRLGEEVAGMAENLDALQEDHQILKENISTTLTSHSEKYDDLDKRVKHLEENMKTVISKNTFRAPNRIPSFYGRVQELKSLAQELDTKPAHCIMSAVCGLGGTGKTSLAIEHVWKCKAMYKGGVFWLSGESPSHFKNSVCEMAREIGTFDQDFTSTLSRTLHWLKTRSEVWCVVVDNLDEYDLKSSTEIMKVLNGHWKNDAYGHIVITTRRDVKQIQEDVPEVLDKNCIQLGTFSVHESIEFIKIRTERPAGNADAAVLTELSEELGYLPLALDQASAYLKCTGAQFLSYLKRYKAQKLKTLERYKAYYPAQDASVERIAVNTTWQLNFEYVRRMSEDYGIGKAACLIMEVSAFIFPDDIPLEIINEGLPKIENRDLQDCLAFETGLTDIISILTKFSLFQKFTDNSLSVHRLVQEVIRSNVSKEGKIKDVLQSASRILQHAFHHSNSPENVCKNFQGDTVFHQTDPPSLYLWGKLGLHASALHNHLIDACKNDALLRQEMVYTEETAFLLNQASLYLYVSRQKVKAMELQKRKLEIMTSLEMSDEKISQLNYFEIPLKDVEFKLISHCMVHKEEQVELPLKTAQEVVENTVKADEWREKGNSAFKEKDYLLAIDCYTVALKWSRNDCRSLSNRSLCFLKTDEAEKALNDCERCLELEKHNKKALRRKAWALYEMYVYSKTSFLKGRERATAALAAYVDPTALEETAFKRMFPRLHYEEICNPAQLAAHLLYLNTDATFLLHGGCYDLQGAVIDKNVQFVGIDGQVTMTFGQEVVLLGSHLYAEGISFPQGSAPIICEAGGSVTMLRCHISSGKRGCEDFPECNGGDDCAATMIPGRKMCDRSGHFGDPEVSGVSGTAGIQISDQCFGHFENCSIEGCGGGGLLSHGAGSKLYVKGCKVHHNHQSGLEAREGGCLEAIDNDIYSNGFHGVMIGPRANASSIVQNRIFENRKEGIYVLFSMSEEMKIARNRIYHNLPLGISLDRCLVDVKQNEIFENGFYGIHAKILTTATVVNNDIYSNKCGGIHMGINFSGRFIIESNTVRDHNGLWLVESGLKESNSTYCKYDPNLFLPEGETRFYSNPPIIKDNVLKNNKEKMFHPQKKIDVMKNECAYCRSSGQLLRCSRCNVASYCSTKCQENHWGRHQTFCSSLSKKYFVNVDFVPCSDVNAPLHVFHPRLKGIGKGTKPDHNSSRRFIVKVQTQHLNCHPLQKMILYDQTTSVDGQIQSPEVYNIIMECGVLGNLKFTSKKAFFNATFIDKNPRKLKIDLAELADYQDW